MVKMILARTALCVSILLMSALAFMASGASSSPADEAWEISMTLYVPRIYDNTQSKGSRKYQTQRLEGSFTVKYYKTGEPATEFCSLVNKTHKINGIRVTYDTFVDSCLWHGIGSNRTGLFKTRSVVLNITAEPSYAIGDMPTEDNSLIMALSGRSTGGNQNRLRGYAAGQIGCGCFEYGHVSPTRIWYTSTVVDTAAVFGTWTAKRVK